MSDEATREPQYQALLDLRERVGLERLGLMSSQVWHDDPKRLTFVLARYKFVAKMFAGRARVLEVGCADAFGTRIVQQEAGHVTCVDFDPVFARDAAERSSERWPIDYVVQDLRDGPVPGEFDAAYALDVLEHVPVAEEAAFIEHLSASLTPHGALILGMPSLESQPYASPQSKEGHVNCKSGPAFRALLERWFHNVFLFSMNDEVVHTGYHAMAHYLLVLCCGRRT